MTDLDSYFQFDDQNRAIRIARFDTPQAWINYLSNGRFHAFVSQAGGGFAWWHSPVCLRLTRYRQYNLPIDSPGFYVYIRHADGTYWSPSQRPCETKLDHFEACHQPGITTFTASKRQVQARLSLFVPPDYDALVWELELTNLGHQPQELDAFAYVEYSQLAWEPENKWGYYCKLQLRTWYDAQSQSTNYLYHGGSARPYEAPVVFLASDRQVASYSGSRNQFVGDYRSERNPLAVERGHCGNDSIDCGEAAGALQNRLLLSPGETVRLHYYLGVGPGALVDLPKAEIERDRVLTALRMPQILDEQKAKREAWWKEHFDAYQCQVPDPVVERQINTWNVVNSVTTGRYSRSVNTMAPGIRGIGFRDSCQDMLAIAYRRPDWATDMLCFLLSQQYRDGHVVHYAYPEEKAPPTTSVHSDNHLWTPLVAYAILSETGDYSLLERRIGYLAPDHVSEDGAGTLWEHLVQAMRFTENNRGRHGLPLTFHSDWNDIIGRFNQRGEGETVFAAMQYVLCLRQLCEIAEHVGKPELAFLRECLERQTSSLLACAWDGAWWRRAFDDDGNPVGSLSCEAGQLFLNPQSWAVLSSLGTKEQQRRGLDAAREQLLTEVGLKLLNPSFAAWCEPGGPKTGYGPGCGENGAIFCHANTWAIMAEALLGNADRAWEYFTQVIPYNAMRKVGIERYRAEPYAWVSNIVGPDNNRFGWANVEQITGTAPWMDIAATQYLLGIRPTLEGLLVDPCIPGDWRGYRVTRQYRGTTLLIDVRNESGAGMGVKSTSVGEIHGRGALIRPEQVPQGANLPVVVVV
jgi:cellobiose phosphorylase